MQRLHLSPLDVTALLFAALLSLACLARGAVYDALLAFFLLLSLPILILGLGSAKSLHPTLKVIGLVFLLCLTLVLFLQQWLHGAWLNDGANGLAEQTIEKLTAPNTLLFDQAGWLNAIGRLLLCIIAYAIALSIGSSESSAKLFLQGLLVCGLACLAFTFFLTRSHGSQAVVQFYAHGFINPNNAGTYLGVILLLALAQSARFFRNPLYTSHRRLPQLIDQLTFFTIVQGFFLLFAVLLVFAGLFTTGSRGAIFFSLICSFVFLIIVILKANMTTRARRYTIIGSSFSMILLLGWILLNFGHIFINTLAREGLDHHTRLEVFSAVIPMIQDHKWLGVGLGGFPLLFQQYRPDNISSDGIIDKAHNSYLEFTAEMGLPSLLLLLVCLLSIIYLLFCGIIRRKERYINPTLGFAVLLLGASHSLIDFPLQIPSIAALFIAIIVVCASQCDPRFSAPPHSSEKRTMRRIRIRKRSQTKRITS